MRPSSTVTVRLQVSGQSSVQTLESSVVIGQILIQCPVSRIVWHASRLCAICDSFRACDNRPVSCPQPSVVSLRPGDETCLAAAPSNEFSLHQLTVIGSPALCGARHP